jgi:hypothetical protein
MKKSPPVFPVKLQSYSAQQNSKELNNNYILDVLNKKAQDVTLGVSTVETNRD